MPQSPFGHMRGNSRPDVSPLSSGPQTPMEDPNQRRGPKKLGKPKTWHRESSASNIDPSEAFRTPDRLASQTFDIPVRTIPSLSIDGNAEPMLIPTPAPHHNFPRAMSDGSFNDGADRSSQSGYDTPTAETASLSQASTSVERPKIIYRLALNDYKEGPINGTTFRYSFKPFDGLNRIDDPRRHELAVMDLSSNVLGYWPHGGSRRRNQLRDSFWKDEDQRAFVVGVDFISRSHTFYSIRIHSKRVLDCLRKNIKYYPDLGLALDQPEVSFEYPYRALIHYYDELQGMRADCSTDYATAPESSTLLNPRTREDLDVVLGYLETIYTNEIQPDLHMHKQDPPVAKFDSLWLLFKPGDTVFARIKGQLMFFKVLSANREIDKAGDPTGPWSIIVWGLYFDGYLLRRQSRKFKIHEYHGAKEIQKLPVKPIAYLEESDGTEEDHIARGKEYYHFICHAPLYRRYNGPVNGNGGEQYIGDVIVDPTAYIKEHANSKALPGVFETMFGARDQDDLGEVMYGDPPDYGGGPQYSKLNDRVCTKDAPKLENKVDYMLLPGYIQGYALRGKKWMAFSLGSFEPWESDDKPWKSLVINEKDFNLVQSLAYSVKDHQGTELSPWTGDFIAGKGQGQVVLLHGPSGVGKTMTVECIAAQMKRPLLYLTVADIGLRETEAELNLSKWLALATKWGAIALIDEAETFLTKRDEGELAQNAIVAAFLRTLEYHQGMIFLTTNAPGSIDDAIISRIHLAIRYKPLVKSQRKEIWGNLMDQLEKEQDKLQSGAPKISITRRAMTEVIEESDFEAVDLDKLAVSGRDIRNAFQAAVRLARYEAHEEAKGGKVDRIQLEAKHFKRAFQSKLALKQGVDDIFGQTAAQSAQEKGWRRDT